MSDHLEVEIPSDRRDAVYRYRDDPVFRKAIDTASLAGPFSREQLISSEGPATVVVPERLL